MGRVPVQQLLRVGLAEPEALGQPPESHGGGNSGESSRMPSGSGDDRSNAATTALSCGPQSDVECLSSVDVPIHKIERAEPDPCREQCLILASGEHLVHCCHFCNCRWTSPLSFE